MNKFVARDQLVVSSPSLGLFLPIPLLLSFLLLSRHPGLVLLHSLHSSPRIQILLIFQDASGVHLHFEASSQKCHLVVLTRIFHSMHYVTVVWTLLHTTLYISLIVSYLRVGQEEASSEQGLCNYNYFLASRSLVLKSIHYVCLSIVNLKSYHPNVLCTL